jgi:hypothetical protein
VCVRVSRWRVSVCVCWFGWERERESERETERERQTQRQMPRICVAREGCTNLLQAFQVAVWLWFGRLRVDDHHSQHRPPADRSGPTLPLLIRRGVGCSDPFRLRHHHRPRGFRPCAWRPPTASTWGNMQTDRVPRLDAVLQVGQVRWSAREVCKPV